MVSTSHHRLPKPVECTPPRVNCNVNWILAIMTGQCKSISSYKSTSLGGTMAFFQYCQAALHFLQTRTRCHTSSGFSPKVCLHFTCQIQAEVVPPASEQLAVNRRYPSPPLWVRLVCTAARRTQLTRLASLRGLLDQPGGRAALRLRVCGKGHGASPHASLSSTARRLSELCPLGFEGRMVD